MIMKLTPDQTAKKLFAEAWLKHPDDPYKAALACSFNDHQIAQNIFQTWTSDREVEDFKRQLLAERGHESFLPSKEQMLEDIMTRAKHCADNDQYAKLMKLAADMRGMIEKPGVTINNHQTVNKVMNIPMFMNKDDEPFTDAQWETKALTQQEKLTSR